MREIKFRCWNAHAGMMHSWEELVAMNKIHLLANQQGSYPVMQFTGLTDVNGVEIYEGDIVKRTYSVWPNKKTFSVVLVAELSCSTFDDDIGGGQDYEENTLKLEVIGNIHQNPELLEK